MKKILISVVLLLLCINLPVFSACKIDKLEYCKADISTSSSSGLNNNSSEKINTTKIFTDNNLKKSEIQKEIQQKTNFSKNSQPYNSNCQFGDCLNPDNTQK